MRDRPGPIMVACNTRAVGEDSDGAAATRLEGARCVTGRDLLWSRATRALSAKTATVPPRRGWKVRDA
jgi:hypothetical protein